jgi:hypothetical protein
MTERVLGPAQGRRGIRLVVLAPLMAIAAFVAWSLATPAEAPAASVTPVFVDGNPTCAELVPGSIELKAEPPVDGTYTDGVLTVTIDVRDTTDGQVFDWTSNIGVDAVFAKGGSGGNLYSYGPESTGDTGLHAPVNPNNDKYFGLSHISFCYDIELEVAKTATTTFTRDFDWTIEKSNDSGSSAQDPLEIQENQPIDVHYQVKVTKDAGTDSGWAVSGTISVKNPHPSAAANGVAVTDLITPGDIAATVDCDPNTTGNQATGLTIASGATLQCTYGPVSLPDGTSRVNTATATTTTVGIGGDSGTADVPFGAPTTVNDDCVDVDDTFGEGPDANVCATTTFNYTVTFNTTDHPLECGESSVENTASLATDDGQTETATSTVWFDKLCDGKGCTLTQGYWKTHSALGPAAHPDDTWLLLASGPNTTFYLSGQSWFTVFWTAPQGNAYYNLAHQFMAAKLNVLAGASTTPAVDSALAAAHTFFSTYTPANWPKAQKNAILALATTLDQYNNGLIGPGHCDGDVVS